MHERARKPKLERAVVLELLSGEDERVWSCSELAAATGEPREDVEEAVRGLHDVGVLHASAEGVSATSAALRLDALGLIGI
jgi:predicted transcriptional regulator